MDQPASVPVPPTAVTSLDDTTSLSQKTKCYHVKRRIHQLCSINIAFITLIFVSIIIAVLVVGMSSLFTGRRIVLQVGDKLREALSLKTQRNLELSYGIATNNMNVIVTMLRLQWDSLRTFWTNSVLQERVLLLVKSMVDVDAKMIAASIVFADGSSATYRQMARYNYMIVTPAADNFLANITVYNKTSGDIVRSYSSQRTATDYLLVDDSISSDEFFMSRVFVDNGTSARAYNLVKRLYNTQKQQYGELVTTHDVTRVEDSLRTLASDRFSYTLVTDNNGSLIATTAEYSPTIFANYYLKYRSIRELGDRELNALYAAVIKDYGSWENIRDVQEIRYTSPGNGDVVVTKSIITYPNQEWFILVAWPATEWTKQINRTVGINIGVACAVVFASVVLALLLSVPITRSIRQIKDSFRQVKKMRLDAPVIQKATGKRYWWYETAELQTSFVYMLNALKSFQKYVPPQVVHSIVTGSEATLGLVPEICTVFFLDIKDFTKHSEVLPSHLLVQMMSDTFEVLTTVIVTKNAGTIDKYIGDAIMAYWNKDDHELKACKAAIECKSALQRLSATFITKSLPVLECRIGISSGPVLIGNFGSTNRFNYTVLGDTVNIASRVESLNKLYDSTIIMTESTHKALPPRHIFSRRLDIVQVKGKETSTLVYEVLKEYSDATVVEKDKLITYNRAFDLYMSGNFEDAKEQFESMINYQNDPVVLKKMVQCDEYRQRGTWNGTIRLNTK